MACSASGGSVKCTEIPNKVGQSCGDETDCTLSSCNSAGIIIIYMIYFASAFDLKLLGYCAKVAKKDDIPCGNSSSVCLTNVCKKVQYNQHIF